MANNVAANRITVFYYFGNGAGRLRAPVGAGEIDLTTVVNSTNTNAIYGAQVGGGYRSFVPGSAFPSLSALTAGEGYFIDAKTAFELPHVLPHTNATVQANAIAYLQGTPGPTPGPSPTPGPTPGPTPTPGSGMQLNTASPFYAGLKTYYVGKENKDLVTGVTGTLLNLAGGSPTFTYPTVDTRDFIEAATFENIIEIPLGASGGTYNDFTMLYYGAFLEDPHGGQSVMSIIDSSGNRKAMIGGFLDTAATTGGNAYAAVVDTAGEGFAYGAGQWARSTYAFWALRRQAGVVHLFRNGAQLGNDNRTAEAFNFTGGSVLIGRDIKEPWGNRRAKTRTMLAALYNRALTNAELATLNTTPFSQVL